MSGALDASLGLDGGANLGAADDGGTAPNASGNANVREDASAGADAGRDAGATDAGSQFALRWLSPVSNAMVQGKVQLTLGGTGLVNVEIKRDQQTIATCVISNGGTSASVELDATRFPNGTVTLAARGSDSPAGQPSTHDADAGPLVLRVDNPTRLPSYAELTGVCASSSDFPKLQALGVRNARVDHPSAELIEEARRYGIEVLPIADDGFPDLSGENDQMFPPLPQNRAAWAKRLVDKWRTMQNPPRVFEVWNEPWLVNFWKPMPDAVAYLQLVKAFAKEAWAVWPQATLLVSADHISSRKNYIFIDELLKADTTGFLNDPRILPTTHNYVEARTPTERSPTPCAWDLDRFACAYDKFKAHGHPNPQVWVTEFGWESSTPGGTTSTTTVSEQMQADYTRQALQLFRSSGKVARAYAFLFHENDPWNFNWLRPDNSQKPVCATVKQMIATGN